MISLGSCQALCDRGGEHGCLLGYIGPPKCHSNIDIEMQLTETPPLLDIKGLAGYLRVSTRTMENILTRGEGPPYLRLGRQRRWRPADVQMWLQERAQLSQGCNSPPQ